MADGQEGGRVEKEKSIQREHLGGLRNSHAPAGERNGGMPNIGMGLIRKG
jgi:hypothetical protein